MIAGVTVRCQPSTLQPNVSGCVSDWPALSWTHAYLRERLGATPVHVALTPDGLGDAVKEHDGQLVFAKPHEALMPFTAFLDALETPLRTPPSAPPPAPPPPAVEVARRVGELRVDETEGRGAGEAGGGGRGGRDGGVLRRAVHYCSHQNSSLTEEFARLQDDWRPLAWADAAFGAPPVATNLWMGEDASHTTVHADLFDNLYVVVRGEKRFSLLPPQEGHLLRRRRFPAATYRPAAASGGGEGGGGGGGGGGGSGLELALDDPPEQQLWSALDLEREGARHGAPPITATVRAGELLYLPALWWHAVSQRGGGGGGGGDGAGGSTIAINLWYDPAEALTDAAAEAMVKAIRSRLDAEA